MADNWRIVGNSEVLAVHAALLPSGKVLFFGGDQHDEAPASVDATRLWDPLTGRVTRVPSPRTLGNEAIDLFCCGHCQLPSGDILVAGGTDRFDVDAPKFHGDVHHFTGISSAAVFDWAKEEWFPTGLMNSARWYPTLATLSDGTVIAMSGHSGSSPGPHENTSVDRYDPSTGLWTAPFPPVAMGALPSTTTTPPLQDTGGDFWVLWLHIVPMVYYPRLHLLEGVDDRLFSSTALRTAGKRKTCELNGRTGTITTLSSPPPGEEVGYYSHVYTRSAFGSVLLPLRPPDYKARILITGGEETYIFEPNNAHLGWLKAGESRPYPMRAYLNSVLLPDGTVLCVGGARSERGQFWRREGLSWGINTTDSYGFDADHIPFAEQFDPATDSWRTLSSPSYPSIPRVYHSVALLLPDARIWIAGSNHDSMRNHAGQRADGKGDARELRMEVYTPPYLFATKADGTDLLDMAGNPVPAVRPTITSLNRGTAGYGQTVTVTSPDARTISRVVLIRGGTVTHAHNFDQRLVQLLIASRTATTLTVEIPDRPKVLPPGYYMLFLLNGTGTPSVAKFLRISHSAPLVQVETTESGDAYPYDFGTLMRNEQRSTAFHFRNDGSGTLEIIGTVTDGDFRKSDVPADPFLGTFGLPRNLRLDLLQATAAHGQEVRINATFIGVEAGNHLGTLELSTNAVNRVGIRIPLHALVNAFEIVLIQPQPGTIIDLGSVNVGDQKVVSVVLRNIGTLGAVLDSYTFSDPAAGSQIGIGLASIQPNQIKTYTLTYAPARVGTVSTDVNLHFTDVVAPARNSQNLTLKLTARGLGAQAELSPPSLDFGTVPVGRESAPRTIFIHNVGSSVLTVSSTLLGSDFRIAGPVPSSVGPGATEPLAIVFRPGHGGFLAGTFSVSSNSVLPPVPVAIQGIGVLQPSPHARPDTLAFATTPVGSSRELITVVRNDGSTPMQVGTNTVVGADAAEFQIIGSTCAGATLAPEQQCEIRVRFRPTSSGTKQAAIELTYNGPDSPLVIPLSGIAIPTLGLVADVSEVSFGRVPVGGPPSTSKVILTNAGTVPAHIVGVAIAGAAATDFSVVSDGCSGGTLAPATRCAVGLSVQPASPGARIASLSANSDVGSVAITLRAEGVAITAAWSAAVELDFGDIAVGNWAPRQDVFLRNTGNGVLTVSLIEIVGDFIFRDIVPTIVTIQPNGEKYFSVQFKPTAAGTREGALRVHSDAQGSPHSLALTGVGTLRP